MSIKMKTDDSSNYIYTATLPSTATFTVSDSYWQPLGVISDGYSELQKRVDKLERLVGVLTNALGVNEEFVSCVADTC